MESNDHEPEWDNLSAEKLEASITEWDCMSKDKKDKRDEIRQPDRRVESKYYGTVSIDIFANTYSVLQLFAHVSLYLYKY